MAKNRFNWDLVSSEHIKQFAYGLISGNQFYSLYKNTSDGGKVRNLLRERGVTKARNAARCAWNRISRTSTSTVVNSMLSLFFVAAMAVQVFSQGIPAQNGHGQWYHNPPYAYAYDDVREDVPMVWDNNNPATAKTNAITKRNLWGNELCNLDQCMADLQDSLDQRTDFDAMATAAWQVEIDILKAKRDVEYNDFNDTVNWVSMTESTYENPISSLEFLKDDLANYPDSAINFEDWDN